MNRMESSRDTPIHQIRLAGPWKFSIVTKPRIQIASTTVRLPHVTSEVFSVEVEHFQLARRFQRPSNLLNDRIVLAFFGLNPSANVFMNHHQFCAGSISRRNEITFVDITSELEMSNLLEIRFPASLANGTCLLTSATLEIYAADSAEATGA